MSNTYRLVQWNAHKRVYDLVMVGGVVAYLATFAVVGSALWRDEHAVSAPVLAMRALGTCAIVLLHVILCIGPLARLSTLFAPLLYNRRHMGVTMFLLALGHAVLATLYYGGFGGVNPLGAVLGAGSFRSVSGFPFEWLGLFALLVLFVMAATSHDFWLANLGATVWKRLHMGVYVAYAALVLHVLLGAFQREGSSTLGAAIIAGVAVVGGLHTAAGVREWRRDRTLLSAQGDGWIDAAGVDEIRDGRAKVVRPRRADGRAAEPIALFRNGDAFSAISNVCAHQGGPLGEGKIVGGCVTCPWHGYQYLPENGQSPPPFTEKIATYEVRVRGDRVEVRASALAPGTPVEPARCARAVVKAKEGGA